MVSHFDAAVQQGNLGSMAECARIMAEFRTGETSLIQVAHESSPAVDTLQCVLDPWVNGQLGMLPSKLCLSGCSVQHAQPRLCCARPVNNQEYVLNRLLPLDW